MLTTRIDLRMTAEFLSRIFLRQIRAQRDTNIQTIRNSTEVPAKPRNHRIEEKTNCQTMVSVHHAMLLNVFCVLTIKLLSSMAKSSS